MRERIERALEYSGSREIGGVLMGECIESGRFRVADLTVQDKDGTSMTFIRAVRGALLALGRFFRRTGRQYTHFNYLGEWHSHPSFAAEPSARDIESMQEIAGDETVGANFLILLVVKKKANMLEASATVFWPDDSFGPAQLTLEHAK